MSVSLPLLRDILQAHPGIRQALLFGSVASGRAGPASDLDIAVEAERPLTATEKLALVDALASAFGRPVDLIDLGTAAGPLLGQILRHGRRILGSDADHARLLTRHLLDAEDFQPYVQRMLRERRRAWIG